MADFDIYDVQTESDSKHHAKRAAAEVLLYYLTGKESENVTKGNENIVHGKGLLKLIMSKYYPLEKIAA